MKAYYCFANLKVEAEYQNLYLKKQCADYELQTRPDAIDLSFSVGTSDVQTERERTPDVASVPDGYLESLAFYRKLCEQIPYFNAFLYHGSALSVNGDGFLFGAPSGTGKSTHARLYRQVYGDAVFYVNDDKPLIRKTGNGFLVYGTPWDGKHHLSRNCAVPLKGLCFLRQGPENRIRRLSQTEAFVAAMKQIYRPYDATAMQLTVSLTQKLIEQVPAFELICTISEEAVRLSYETMKGAVL